MLKTLLIGKIDGVIQKKEKEKFNDDHGDVVTKFVVLVAFLVFVYVLKTYVL